MRTTVLLLAGVAIGWGASGVAWTRPAVGQEGAIGVGPASEAEATSPAGADPAAGGERSIRRQRDGVLRRRGLLPSRETPPAATAPSEAPAFAPASEAAANAEAMPYGNPGAELVAPLDDLEATRGPTLALANPAASSVGRYQVAAFNTSTTYGYYVIDTATGRVWYGLHGSAPQLVVGMLPER